MSAKHVFGAINCNFIVRKENSPDPAWKKQPQIQASQTPIVEFGLPTESSPTDDSATVWPRPSASLAPCTAHRSQVPSCAYVLRVLVYTYSSGSISFENSSSLYMLWPNTDRSYLSQTIFRKRGSKVLRLRDLKITFSIIQTVDTLILLMHTIPVDQINFFPRYLASSFYIFVGYICVTKR